MRVRKNSVLYVVLIVVWGVVWPLSKVALDACPPVLFAGLRVLLSGIVLLPFTLRHLTREALRVNLVLAILNVFLFYGLQNLALQHAPAGLVSILVYIQPVVTVVLARFWLQEGITAVKLAGVMLGFIGVGLISIDQVRGHHTGGLDAFFALMAGLSWALGTVVYKKYRTTPHPIQDMGIQLMVGGVLLLGLGSVTEPWTKIRWSGPFLGELAFVGLLGTALAWIIWSRLLHSGDASRVAAWTFLVPILATVLSVLWLKETLTMTVWVGGACVMLGLYGVNGMQARRGRASRQP